MLESHFAKFWILGSEFLKIFFSFLKLSLPLNVYTLKSGFYLVCCFGDKVDTHKHADIHTDYC